MSIWCALITACSVGDRLLWIGRHQLASLMVSRPAAPLLYPTVLAALLELVLRNPALEGQKAALEDKLAATPDAEPLLHPALATIYRNMVEKLEISLRQPETHREAFGLIRGLIDAIMPTPIDGRLEIELRGNLAGILALSEAGKGSAFSPKEKALQIKMVAGAGFVQERTRWELRRLA
jgi:hypothetical protein